MELVQIENKKLGPGQPCLIVGEMSANHDQDLDQALKLVDLAADAGVDAIKLQTYTADSLTLPTDHPSARINKVWGAATLYELYGKATMPYEFHGPIFERTRARGMIAFSTAYDEPAVDYLEKHNVPAYKVASFELVHLPLLKHIAATKKPVVLSTGMATLAEVEEGLETLEKYGCKDIVLLHCCSSYPANPADVNLSAITTLVQAFGRPVGFSDHTVGSAVPTAAVAMGACMIEKHYTNDINRKGPDHRFSADGPELKRMVEGIRQVEAAKGTGRKRMAPSEAENRLAGRRSIFTTVALEPGQPITREMLRVVRPGSGLHPRYLDQVVGRPARRKLPAGWPITWEDI
jgi:pseudaminic acid synthase